MDNNDITFLDALKTLDDPVFWSIYNSADKMSVQNLAIYHGMLNELIIEHEKRGCIDKGRRGKLLESLVNFLLSNSGDMYKVYPNFHTSTNEIDQIIELSEKGKACQKLGSYDFKGTHFLGECKNYQTKISVTFVGKFCHLSLVSASKLGILFSYHGFKGGPWTSSNGLVKKFYLSKENINERYYIIDFNINDFKLIEKGLTFYQIVSKKCIALETDTKYEDLLETHPAEHDLPSSLP